MTQLPDDGALLMSFMVDRSVTTCYPTVNIIQDISYVYFLDYMCKISYKSSLSFPYFHLISINLCIRLKLVAANIVLLAASQRLMLLHILVVHALCAIKMWR